MTFELDFFLLCMAPGFSFLANFMVKRYALDSRYEAKDEERLRHQCPLEGGLTLGAVRTKTFISHLSYEGKTKRNLRHLIWLPNTMLSVNISESNNTIS